MIQSIGNPLLNAVSGMKSAAKDVANSASRIANIDTNGANIEEEMVNTLSASQSYKANAQIISMTKRMEDALGQIFDEKA
jgi:flagellar hook-associated protein FlgK